MTAPSVVIPVREQTSILRSSRVGTRQAIQSDRHLDAASLVGLPYVRIIHGKGTGKLRKAVREFLTGHPLVSSHEPGARSEGGDGVTVAKLAHG